jgi:hypothetical protein
VRKGDIVIAKNYLSHDEIDTLNRLVVIFLESAELRAKNRQDLNMDFWRTNVDRILEFQDKAVLNHAGSISKADMEKQVKAQYEKFDQRRKTADAQAADAHLKALEEKVKQPKP